MVVCRDTIERELINGLQREVLREDVAAYALEELKLRTSRVQLQRVITLQHCLTNLGTGSGNWTVSAKSFLQRTAAD